MAHRSHAQERTLELERQGGQKFFPTHGAFKGKVQQYHYACDNSTITYKDNDVERVPYISMTRVVSGTPEHIEHQSIVKALHVAFIAAATDPSSTVNNDVTPNSYKEARASIEAAGWQQSMDEEIENIDKVGCWTVIPQSSLSPNTPVMGTRWTYRKKTDENGTFTRSCGRVVAKGFSQILGVSYFESLSPVASFVTIGTLFALTLALPMFKVYQYEDRRQYVYQLHKCLYGMNDSPPNSSRRMRVCQNCAQHQVRQIR